MSDDPAQPETLLSVATEAEAAAIVTALAGYGIEAMADGGYLSGLQIGIAGDLRIVVKRADLPRAQEALAELREKQSASGEPPDDEADLWEFDRWENDKPRATGRARWRAELGKVGFWLSLMPWFAMGLVFVLRPG